MDHNTIKYWQRLAVLPPDHEDVPAPRVCRLLQRLFDRWERKPVSLTADDLPHLFRGIPDADAAAIAAKPVAVRKAWPFSVCLESVSNERFRDHEGVLRNRSPTN